MMKQERPGTSSLPAAAASSRNRLNGPLFRTTGSFVLLFCAVAVISPDILALGVDAGFHWSARYFGLYWQLLLLLTFVTGLVLCVLPGGGTILGRRQTPEFPDFQWGAMILCTLLAGGGVFWAAGEPVAHYLSPPPLFASQAGDGDTRAHAALAQSYLHWGFVAWAILGALTTVVLMHCHHEHGLPLAPRTLLWPAFGMRAVNGPAGLATDTVCIIAVVAGTVGPIGFLGLQVSYGLNVLFGIPDSLPTRIVVVLGLTTIYLVSAISGLKRGIQILSRLNIALVFILMAFMLAAGPTTAIIDGFLGGMSVYLSNFIDMAMFRGEAGLFGEPGWTGRWTVFFWGWFLGYGPMSAIFIARVSRGRSVRSIILTLSVMAPLVTNFWFAVLGGSGIGLEQAHPGVISDAFGDFNLPAVLLAITRAMPYGFLLSLSFLVLTMIFVATTSDSMSFAIAASMSSQNPPVALRAFWALSMAVMALVLTSASDNGVNRLQDFIVITAVPVSLVLLPSLMDAPRIVLAAGRTQDSPEGN